MEENLISFRECLGGGMTFLENDFPISHCLGQKRTENYFLRKIIFSPMEENDFLFEKIGS